MDANQFGKFFSQHRLDSGFKSQRKLADASKISNGTIARIEDGTQKATPETLKVLSKYLKSITYNELMEQAGYIDFTETTYDVNDQNYDVIRENYPNGNWVVKENSPSYIEKEFVDIAKELKKLTDELDMDLRDPETLDTIKGALDLIKRAKGK